MCISFKLTDCWLIAAFKLNLDSVSMGLLDASIRHLVSDLASGYFPFSHLEQDKQTPKIYRRSETLFV